MPPYDINHRVPLRIGLRECAKQAAYTRQAARALRGHMGVAMTLLFLRHKGFAKIPRASARTHAYTQTRARTHANRETETGWDRIKYWGITVSRPTSLSNICFQHVSPNIFKLAKDVNTEFFGVWGFICRVLGFPLPSLSPHHLSAKHFPTLSGSKLQRLCSVCCCSYFLYYYERGGVTLKRNIPSSVL